MTGIRFVAVLLSGGFLAAAAPAQADTMVFARGGDVWLAKPDGSEQRALTRDGTPGRPYFSPSIADDGTIVALRGVLLHSFRRSGRRIVPPRRWALRPTRTLSSEPLDVDLSPNGRVVATDNALYEAFFDPVTSRRRPSLFARFVDFNDFRRYRTLGDSDPRFDYGSPSWIDRRRVLVTSYGPFDAQVLTVRLGRRTRGRAFYRDPGRDPAGANAQVLADAELTRRRDKWAVMRRPVESDPADVGRGTIQVYRSGRRSTASRRLCVFGPRRRIDQAPDPSWSPDGRTLLWHERGRGIFAVRVTSRCGRPQLVVRGGRSPDLSRAR